MIQAGPGRAKEPQPRGLYLDAIGVPERLWLARGPERDALYQAALKRSPPCWPLPGELGYKLRVRYQAQDARTAVRVLALAALLCLNRATLVPWVLGGLVAQLPARERGQFAGYLDPLAIQIALVLTAFFLSLTYTAARRPLLASAIALMGFVALSAPLVWHNPVLIGGGHLGRIVMLLLMLRALLAGLAFRTR